jgi:hypothetical protein
MESTAGCGIAPVLMLQQLLTFLKLLFIQMRIARISRKCGIFNSIIKYAFRCERVRMKIIRSDTKRREGENSKSF